MRRFRRAVRIYLANPYTWRTCWRLANNAANAPSFGGHFHTVRRDGFIYIEPTSNA